MRYTTRAEHEANAAPVRWQVVASHVVERGRSKIDDGEYGWRVGAAFRIHGGLREFVLPVKFGLRSDCQRAVDWMNEQCPPGKTMQETVKLVEARFEGAMGWKAEIIPIACRF